MVTRAATIAPTVFFMGMGFSSSNGRMSCLCRRAYHRMGEVTRVFGGKTKIRQTSVSRMEGERCFPAEASGTQTTCPAETTGTQTPRLTGEVEGYYHLGAEC